MAVVKKGEYIGRYKDGEMYYYSFKPEVIVENGTTLYVRIGDYQEEFPTNRPYMLQKVNDQEKELINKKK